MISDNIKDRIGNFEGDIGIQYIDLKTNVGCGGGNCDVFPASGAIKLLVLIEVFRQMEEGLIKRSDKYVLTPEDYPQALQEGQKSYGALEHLHPGTELTIEDLYRLMVTVSDNIAFNILLKIVSMENVNQTIERYGFKNTKVNRALFDTKSVEKGIENWISVKEMATLFYRMEKGQIVSNQASREMLDLLEKHQRTSVMPYYFKESLNIAHQSGYDDTLILDMGIVYGDNPFVLCMASSAEDTRNAESIMRDITLMCYNNSKDLNKNS